MDYYVRFMYSNWLPAISQRIKKNFKEEFCSNVIDPFTIIFVVLQLRNVPKTGFYVNQNGRAQAVVKGCTAPWPPRSDSTGSNALNLFPKHQFF